jgi:sensor histidine kinase regulating citrate/malate metabolism
MPIPVACPSIFCLPGKEFQMKVLVTVAMLLAVATANAQTTTAPDASKTAAPAARKLSLDHGPRATSTPWVNKQIREREAAQRTQAAIAQAAAADTTAKR